MKSHPLWRERSIWLVVIAALSTSLMWLAVICVLALSQPHFVAPQAFVVLRALAVAIGDLAGHAWPVMALGALGAMMLAFAVRGPAPVRREMRHD